MTEQSPAEAIFFAALQKKIPEERAAYLDAACGNDNDVRRRVERLLAAQSQVGDFLERPSQAEAGPHEPATVPPIEKRQTAPCLPETTSFHGPGEGLGSVIAGRYRLLEALGQGGMGAVFMAQQSAPVKRLVALKLIKSDMDSRQVLARFEAERQALALMDHPNIAKVLDAGATESGRPFFVMELVKGVPVTRFSDERQLSPRERLELFIPVCQAIQHAHQKGIIHRDIKPSNVLVALYDDRPVPKVIDFGVAKAAGSQLTDVTLITGFGAIVGTPEYMSPEQAQLNQLDIDTRSDVYALGVLLYELLTGTTPVDRRRLKQDAVFEILRIIREEEPPRPSMRLSTSEALASIAATRKMEPARLTKLMRGELDWIVMKCLEKDRSRRYETANGLARDLERYLHDEVVEARPPSALYRLRKLTSKHRTALAMATTVLLLLLAGIAVSTALAIRAMQAESVAKSKEREANEQREQANQQRERAEKQAASSAMDIDLKRCEEGQVALGLLRLAETLGTIPEHAKELRECAALNIVAWGQQLAPKLGSLRHDGLDVAEAFLSPDGKTILTLGREGSARLWDSLADKPRAILRLPFPQVWSRFPNYTLVRFSEDGSTVLTVVGHGYTTNATYNHEPMTSYSSDGIVRIWDVASGELRTSIQSHGATLFEARLSRDGSVLVTGCTDGTVCLWNARTGQLLRDTGVKGYALIDVSPDGQEVLIARDGQFDVCFAKEDHPPKRLPGDSAVFSPSGNFAASFSKDALHWWNTADWRVYRQFDLGKNGALRYALARFITDDVLAVELVGLGKLWVLTKDLADPIETSLSDKATSHYPAESLLTVSVSGHRIRIGTDLYDATTGQKLPLPQGRTFQPELSQLTDGGRFVLLHDMYNDPPCPFIVDLATDKGIGFYYDAPFVNGAKTWLALNDNCRIVLRKADASFDAELLRKWCQVVTRGRLNQNGRFGKLDEATWNRLRLELAQLLEANPDAGSLRSAVSDPLYWLRQEIVEASATFPLLDRLVAAEPTWANYAQRASAHLEASHWDLAIRDDLEAARLAGDWYWLTGSSIPGYELAFRALQRSDRPREEYELANRWVNARAKAGVDGPTDVRIKEFSQGIAIGPPPRTLVAGITLYRLGRYADALDTLAQLDVRLLSGICGVFISPWNVLAMMEAPGRDEATDQQRAKLSIYRWNAAAKLWSISPPPTTMSESSRQYGYDPIDLAVRAMCHHNLGHPKEAVACLQQARGILAKIGSVDADGVQFLHEAETLIEKKPRP
jgi:serine/threonine protein kinase